jgi:uncharacterized protein (DUF58 family)
MFHKYIPLIILLIITAALLRDDFAFTLLYFFIGSYAVGTWWNSRSLSGLGYRRESETHAFLGEEVNVNLEVINQHWLPIPWLRLHEGLPVELRGPRAFQQVFNLGPRAHKRFSYKIEARKRGYYPIGPLYLSSGDIFGFVERDTQREFAPQYLTVFPKIVPLTHMTLPSRSPMGTLRHTLPIFADPSRVMGKRDYVAGDSLRWIDWKTTAAKGRMQVRVFEPSIALEAMIIINLNAKDYNYKVRFDATELAIVIAASISDWFIGKRQSIGLFVNGKDPFNEDGIPQRLLPNQGRSHLLNILEILARVQTAERPPLSSLIREQRIDLSWGTTLIVISGFVDDALLHELWQARRAGMNADLIMPGMVPKFRETKHKADPFGIGVTAIPRERDMDIWRK